NGSISWSARRGPSATERSRSNFSTPTRRLSPSPSDSRLAPPTCSAIGWTGGGCGLNWVDIGWGTFAGACTGFATLLGALPALFSRRPSETQQNMMLGFAAGVMLSASYLSLIVPATAFARNNGHGPYGAAGMVALAV